MSFRRRCRSLSRLRNYIRYVSAIHIAPAFPSVLVSGGGDPTLKFWDWMLGTITREVEIFRTVEPYIEVRPSKKRRGQGQWDGFQGESKKRKKRSGGHDTKILEQDSANGRSRAGGDRASESTIPMTEDGGESSSDARDAVLVVHKIDTLTSGNDHHHLIFSAVGYHTSSVYAKIAANKCPPQGNCAVYFPVPRWRCTV
jgi:tRNA (guanine-N(7)-)-methyltransferase subunit TRM82